MHKVIDLIKTLPCANELQPTQLESGRFWFVVVFIDL
jgi:hypothetical protein